MLLHVHTAIVLDLLASFRARPLQWFPDRASKFEPEFEPPSLHVKRLRQKEQMNVGSSIMAVPELNFLEVHA